MNKEMTDLLSYLSAEITAGNNVAETIKTSLPFIKNVRLFFYDFSAKKLTDANDDFTIVDDKKYYDKFSKLNKCEFIIDSKEFQSYSYKQDEDIFPLCITIPLKIKETVIGIFEIEFEKQIIQSASIIKVFSILSNQLVLFVKNQILHHRLEANSDFYDTLKNIAKIIETQYELNYIIPLIGEMIDKFIQNHLIYIFLKEKNEYKLFWPNSCKDTRILKLIKQIKNEPYIISDDEKIGIFPLRDKKNPLGCIVTRSMTDKITQAEIDYIHQFTRQSSVTIARANSYAEILKSATLDALTGLNNRRQFETRLKEEYASAKRKKTNLCTIMLDIDFFKSINDTYGHATGDKVLKTVSNVIKNQLREYDIPSRYGGEEFCILLPQTNIEDANVVAQRLRKAVEHESFEVTDTKTNEKKNINVTISIGLSQYKEGDNAEDIYKRADNALYEAKNKGRNRVIVYE